VVLVVVETTELAGKSQRACPQSQLAVIQTIWCQWCSLSALH